MQSSYDDYVSTVSTPTMALSFETSVFLYALCSKMRLAQAMDLGSGYSSYIFRRYAQEAGYDVDVVSVDDSPEWLDRTREFLGAHGLPTTGVISWNEFVAVRATGFHVILHDFVGGERREAAMPPW